MSGMRLLRRWLHLVPTGRALVAQAVVLMLVARLGLEFFPLRKNPSLLTRIAALLPDGEVWRAVTTDSVGWAVSIAARTIPGDNTCLVQALVAQQLLRRAGYSAELHVGVAKQGDGNWVSHAWVESNGVVVVGGSATSLVQYNQLPRIEELLS